MFLKLHLQNSICLLFLIFGFSTPALADMDFSLIQLGSSQTQTQEILSKNGFLFANITDAKFDARKIALTSKIDNPRKEIREIPPRIDFEDLYYSTRISGKFCAGKLYELNISSYYEAEDELSIWSGRRLIYEYLEKNKAVMEKLSLSKKEGDPNVGFKFNIDRSASGGSVKGVENVTLMIDASGSSGLKLLEMRYKFSNKWFCPE